MGIPLEEGMTIILEMLLFRCDEEEARLMIIVIIICHVPFQEEPLYRCAYRNPSEMGPISTFVVYPKERRDKSERIWAQLSSPPLLLA